MHSHLFCIKHYYITITATALVLYSKQPYTVLCVGMLLKESFMLMWMLWEVNMSRRSRAVGLVLQKLLWAWFVVWNGTALQSICSGLDLLYKGWTVRNLHCYLCAAGKLQFSWDECKWAVFKEERMDMSSEESGCLCSGHISLDNFSSLNIR